MSDTSSLVREVPFGEGIDRLQITRVLNGFIVKEIQYGPVEARRWIAKDAEELGVLFKQLLSP